MPIKVFNTLSNKIESLSQKKINLFVCGPTVYDWSHLGHARTYIFFDFFVKFLRAQKYKVFYLQNITDIDDKIITKARQQNKNPLALSKKFKTLYLRDIKNLNINSVNIYAPATKFIPQIISQVQRLIFKGYAYKIDGEGYYFDVSKFKDYGKLSRRTMFQAEDAVSRIDESIQKRNRADFCLWKFASKENQERLKKTNPRKKFIILNHEPLWNTVIGWGRPGWHIEDTAIAEYYFGLNYDLHGGGLDLKFPHHEAEIAQAEGISNKKPFVKIWMHTGQLMVNGQKMSKSLKNFITINDFLKKYQPIVLRYIVLMHHWQSPLNYQNKTINEAIVSLQAIFETIKKLELIIKLKKFGQKNINIKKIVKKFNYALINNLNTPQALSQLFELIKLINLNLYNLNHKSIQKIHHQIKIILKLLSLNLPKSKIPKKIKALVKNREKLRENKQFMQADDLRNKIFNLGYIIEDTKVGPIIIPKNLWIKSN